MERFWCCFEAWLSMQRCGPNGLTPLTDGGGKRYTIVPVDSGRALAHADLAQQSELLVGMWAGCRVDEAKQHLSSDAIKVTNQKDKKTQLAKVDQLNDEVRAFFKRQGHLTPKLQPLPSVRDPPSAESGAGTGAAVV